ncbi:MAG: hypothetical protein KJO10_04405, partial [Gammaproteobacteria bacterium]|nr:hypothetical protein [Gammaproteobacteria bacterium]
PQAVAAVEKPGLLKRMFAALFGTGSNSKSRKQPSSSRSKPQNRRSSSGSGRRSSSSNVSSSRRSSGRRTDDRKGGTRSSRPNTRTRSRTQTGQQDANARKQSTQTNAAPPASKSDTGDDKQQVQPKRRSRRGRRGGRRRSSSQTSAKTGNTQVNGPSSDTSQASAANDKQPAPAKPTGTDAVKSPSPATAPSDNTRPTNTQPAAAGKQPATTANRNQGGSEATAGKDSRPPVKENAAAD